MKYIINYTETIEHTFEVEADNKDEACKKFIDNSGDYDWSQGKVLDSDYYVTEA